MTCSGIGCPTDLTVEDYHLLPVLLLCVPLLCCCFLLQKWETGYRVHMCMRCMKSMAIRQQRLGSCLLLDLGPPWW